MKTIPTRSRRSKRAPLHAKVLAGSLLVASLGVIVQAALDEYDYYSFLDGSPVNAWSLRWSISAQAREAVAREPDPLAPQDSGLAPMSLLPEALGDLPFRTWSETLPTLPETPFAWLTDEPIAAPALTLSELLAAQSAPGSDRFDLPSVPEPRTTLLLGLSGALLAGLSLRRCRSH